MAVSNTEKLVKRHSTYLDEDNSVNLEKLKTKTGLSGNKIINQSLRYYTPLMVDEIVKIQRRSTHYILYLMKEWAGRKQTDTHKSISATDIY